jgi:hypothetical protein
MFGDTTDDDPRAGTTPCQHPYEAFEICASGQSSQRGKVNLEWADVR